MISAMVQQGGGGRQETFGFLVREVAEGEGFQAGMLRGVVELLERGPNPRVALRLDVAGLDSPLLVDFRPDDLAISYRDESLGIALKGRSSTKMRVRAPRGRKIDRIGGNPTPRFPAMADGG